ncbi:hypothetical protein [Aquirhabdus sp.]|uniref:hypothetical protein n=1 Tax=Aquirhabdus sp. TaxID=2824160 RepID=UPI00396C4D28
MSVSSTHRQAHTRAILAALGIPVWAERTESIQSIAAISLWGKPGDDAIEVFNAQNHIEAVQPVVVAKTQSITTAPQPISSSNEAKPPMPSIQTTASAHIARTESLLQASDPPLIKEVTAPEKPTRQPFAQPIAASEAVHVEQVLRFSLEARVIGEWVVLVSVQALNHPDRRTLWQNINQAFQRADSSSSSEAFRLDWPLAEGARWQHNVGAQAALMGFLTRFGTERRVGLMGELPDSIIPEHLERLPSLDELLQAPLKKRSLWRLLSGQVR